MKDMELSDDNFDEIIAIDSSLRWQTNRFNKDITAKPKNWS